VTLTYIAGNHAMKLSHRRQFLNLAAGAAALPVVTRFARAEAYPSRPITIIVASAVGGATDVIARLLGGRMRQSLGQPVIVENVTGGEGLSPLAVSRARLPTVTRSA
jgi:tripartite-type tricarboxylate transporter receptor subunit TctC